MPGHMFVFEAKEPHPWSLFQIGYLSCERIWLFFCRLRKDLAAFLGLELPSLPELPNNVMEEKEKKERRKNLAAYLGVEENVLSTILPPPPPSTLRQPGKMHPTPSCKAPFTPNGWNKNYISPPPFAPFSPPLDRLPSPKWEVDSAFSSSSTTSSSSSTASSSSSSSSYSTIYLWTTLSNLSIKCKDSLLIFFHT